MIRAFFLTVAVLLGLYAAGLIFGWDHWLFDNPQRRHDAAGWGFLAATSFAAAFHPAVLWFDRTFGRKP